MNRSERRKALKQLGSDTREFFKFLVKECAEAGTDSFSFEWDDNVYTINEIEKMRKMLKI